MLSVKFFIFFILRKFELSKRTRRGRPINVSLGATPHLLPLTEWIELPKKPISDYDHQPHKSQFIVLNWIEQKGFQSLQEAMPNTHMKFRIVLQWPSLMHIVWFWGQTSSISIESKDNLSYLNLNSRSLNQLKEF